MGTIRFLLAISVVLAHGLGFNYLVPMNGNAAVHCFFMISGFYMAMVLTGKYTNPRGVPLFYANRVLRLFPVYFAVCALEIAYRARFAPEGVTFYFNDAIGLHARIQAFASNLSIIGINHLRGPLAQSMGLPAGWRLIPQAWSIDAELVFYFLAPLFLSGRLARGWRLLALAAASLALFLCRDDSIGLALWMLMPRYALFFAAGAVTYSLGRYWVPRNPRDCRWAFAAVASAIVFLCFAFHLDRQEDALAPLYRAIYALFFFAIPLGFAATRTSRVDSYVGELSYPIYLVHMLVIEVVLGFGPRHVVWTSSAAAFAIVLAAAALLKRFVEDPVERTRKRLASAAAPNLVQ